MKVKPSDAMGETAPNDSANRYFKLENGESAIVRFLFTDLDSFDIVDVHNVPMGRFGREVNCLRDINKLDPREACALCVANTLDKETKKYKYPRLRRFYIHLLCYESKTKAYTMVWERSSEYVAKFNQLLKDYDGPLCNRLYKITRRGEKGSLKTTYDILPLEKDKYDPSEYVFDEEQLNYKPALGTVVLDKTNEELEKYIKTGSFSGYRASDIESRETSSDNTKEYDPTEIELIEDDELPF